jgi:hypothetical protein
MKINLQVKNVKLIFIFVLAYTIYNSRCKWLDLYAM